MPEPEPPSSRRVDPPDYTIEQFKKKFKNKSMADWLKESRPYDFTSSVAPNSVEGYLLKGNTGEDIRYRQAMGLSREGQNGSDCVSVLLPGGEPIVGTYGDGTLEVRQTNVKWTFIMIVKKRHFFLYHIDTTDWDKAVPGREFLSYYQQDRAGKFQLKGEMVGRDKIQGTDFSQSLNNLDYCNDTY